MSLFILSRRFGLEGKIHRSVLAIDKIIALAEVVSVYLVLDQEEILVIHCERPETINGGKLTLFKVDDIVVSGAVILFAINIF